MMRGYRDNYGGKFPPEEVLSANMGKRRNDYVYDYD
jgi:hypothetical protein